MNRVWHGPAFTLPFLKLGIWRAIMFPEHGVDVPFTIRNYACVDSFGRETVTWVRTFQTKRTRRFDVTMIYSASRRRIVDYLGTISTLPWTPTPPWTRQPVDCVFGRVNSAFTRDGLAFASRWRSPGSPMSASGTAIR